jgi:hypothetical protein
MVASLVDEHCSVAHLDDLGATSDHVATHQVRVTFFRVVAPHNAAATYLTQVVEKHRVVFVPATTVAVPVAWAGRTVELTDCRTRCGGFCVVNIHSSSSLGWWAVYARSETWQQATPTFFTGSWSQIEEAAAISWAMAKSSSTNTAMVMAIPFVT